MLTWVEGQNGNFLAGHRLNTFPHSPNINKNVLINKIGTNIEQQDQGKISSPWPTVIPCLRKT
jgi:hypothetical protein